MRHRGLWVHIISEALSIWSHTKGWILTEHGLMPVVCFGGILQSIRPQRACIRLHLNQWCLMPHMSLMLILVAYLGFVPAERFGGLFLSILPQYACQRLESKQRFRASHTSVTLIQALVYAERFRGLFLSIPPQRACKRLESNQRHLILCLVFKSRLSLCCQMLLVQILAFACTLVQDRMETWYSSSVI